jgi:hypothetical protein
MSIPGSIGNGWLLRGGKKKLRYLSGSRSEIEAIVVR